MTDFQILPFAIFCLVATGTPGPNNMINLAQGMRLGFRRALPLAVGTGFGIAPVLIAVSLGLGAEFEAMPWARVLMTSVTVLFLLFLAWKIATAGPLRAEGEVRRLGFFSGVVFQWINPKTWVSSMAMATIVILPCLLGDSTRLDWIWQRA
jgi:threonine/homoserine/homoserine lactone efflux protein